MRLATCSRGLSTNLVVMLHIDTSPSRVLTSAVHSMDTIVCEVPPMEGCLLSVMVQKLHKHSVTSVSFLVVIRKWYTKK